ncbi:MAG: hypothetical protein KDE47_34065 [Caldilineaceae bacterium]|nr:hypothetical protein [Caldilineaceae bacterium]
MIMLLILTMSGVSVGAVAGVVAHGMDGLILGASSGLVLGVTGWTVIGMVERFQSDRRLDRFFRQE